jgi:hypothetical protein
MRLFIHLICAAATLSFSMPVQAQCPIVDAATPSVTVRNAPPNCGGYIEVNWAARQFSFDLEWRWSSDGGSTWSGWYGPSGSNGSLYPTFDGVRQIVRANFPIDNLSCGTDVRLEVRERVAKPGCQQGFLSSGPIFVPVASPNVEFAGRTLYQWGEQLNVNYFRVMPYNRTAGVQFSDNGIDWTTDYFHLPFYATNCSGRFYVRGFYSDRCGNNTYTAPVALTWPVTWIFPALVGACLGRPVSVIATAGPGSPRWQRQLPNGNWVDLNNGLLPGGGTVSGVTTGTLTISALDVLSTGPFRINNGNYCGSGLGTLRFVVCLGDLNCDSAVDDTDFVVFAAHYDRLLCADPTMPLGCPSDLNGDGAVDDADFVAFASSYDRLICQVE